MGKGIGVVLAAGLAVAVAVAAPAQAQSKARRDSIIADMMAMMEFMCLKMSRDDDAARKRCVAEQGGALKEMVRMLDVPDPVARTRAARLWELCNNENVTPHGIDIAASLACVRKF